MEEKMSTIMQTRKSDVKEEIQTTMVDIDKKPNGKWDIVGLSSLITLACTAFLFMIGWVHISYWYAYFGVDIERLNIPLQVVLIQGMSTLLYMLDTLLFSLVIYFFVKFIIGITKTVLMSGSFITHLLVFTKNDLLVVSLIALGQLILLQFAIYQSYGIPIELIPVESMFAFSVGVGILGLISFVIFIFGVDYFWNRKRPENILKDPNIYWASFNKIKNWIIGILLLFTVMVAVSMSAMDAISQAADGRKSIGKPIQVAILVAPRQLDSIQELKIKCNQDGSCTYGPFLLVAETDASFYLVKWEDNSGKKFQSFPELYIMPRSEQSGAYFVIPYSYINSTATPLPVPSVTVTPTPKIAATPTVELSLTPFPVSTSIQP